MKLLYVVLDGLGDLPSSKLEGQTPLEAAETPIMDSFAKTGMTGMVYPVREGVAPESDVAVISILGYDPFKYYTGRGPLEAHGSGLDMADGDLALRCNFSTMSEDGKIIDRRVGRNLTDAEASILADSINQNLKLTNPKAKFFFKNTVAHRGVLLIKRLNGKLSGKITNTDPAYARLEGLGVARKDAVLKLEKCQAIVDSEEAQASAALVNEFTEKSRTLLRQHEINMKRISEGKPPANVILMRDAGDALPKFPSLQRLYKIRFGCMVEMPVERGIALLCGMEELELPPSTGNPEEDYKLRANKTVEALERLDSIYIHIKGPDEPGHDGECLKKKEIIELIDKHYFGALIEKLDLANVLVAVTADHATPCTIKAHSEDPVPLLISGGKAKPDGTLRFGEKYCRNGSLGILRGPEIMPLLMKLKN